MSNFNIKTFSPKKHYAIKASAGTGKTYNIMQIIGELVKTHGVDLDKILVVTYTEKAAGELKDRIRTNFPNMAEKMAVHTIHSFCRNAIEEFGVSASLPLELDLAGDDFALDFAKQYVRTGNLLDAIANNNANGDRISNMLSEGVKKYYLDFLGKEVPGIVTNLDGNNALGHFLINYYKYTSFAQMLTSFPALKYHYDKLKNSSEAKEIDFAGEIEATALNQFNFKGSKYQLRYMKTVAGENAFSFFDTIKKSLKDSKFDRDIAAVYLPEFYLAFQKAKEERKVQSYDDMLRYVRETVLTNTAFKNALQNRFSYGIIDEFQDTNQKQADIFKSIFMEDDDHHLIVVGDEKQAIYRFQGADVTVYQKATDQIAKSGGEICELSKNWRSTKEMVEACNELFAQEEYWKDTFTPSEYLDVSSAVNPDPYDHRAYYQGAPVKAIWQAENTPEMYDFAKVAVQQIIDFCTIDPSTGNTNLRLKDGRWTNERNVNFRDIVILAKQKTEMPAIMNALKTAGIPYIRYKDNNLFKGMECAHWIALLQAIDAVDFTGRNRNIYKKAIFTDFFAVSLKDLNLDAHNTDSTVEMGLLNHWRSLAHEYRWEDMIDDILINSELSKKNGTLKGIQAYSVFKQIGEYCIDALTSGKSLGSLISNLSNLANGSDSTEDEEGVYIEKGSDFNCVRIMTIHASKGLEFPVVICVGGNNSEKEVVKRTCEVVHIQNATNLVFNVSSYKSEIEHEDAEELKRLFYVAFTRAQFVLMLPSYDYYKFPFLEESLRSLYDANPNLFQIFTDTNIPLASLSAESVKILSQVNPILPCASSPAAQDIRMQGIIKHKSAQSTYKHSYSSLSHGARSNSAPLATNDPDDDSVNKEGSIVSGLTAFDKAGKQILCDYDASAQDLIMPVDYPRGAEIGTALHEVFEKIDFQNNLNNLDSVIKKAFKAQRIPVKSDWVDCTKEMVMRVLNANLPIVHGSSASGESVKLKDLPNSAFKKEMEFNFNVFGQKLGNYLNGFVDLVFKNGDVFSIADWKSDRLNDEFTSYSSGDEIKGQVDSRYSIQRALYSYCLIKWLKSYYMDLSEDEIFNQHFGGIYYIFLRGCSVDTGNGVYCQTWDSWDDLKSSFNQIISSMGGK